MNKHKKWCIGFLGIMLVSLFTMGFAAKLSISGGTPYEIKNVLKKAISTGKVKNAIVCVDGYMYKNEIDFHRTPYPEYLYDNNPFNDLRYLLNLVIFKDAVQLYTNNKSTPEGFDINNLYLDNPNKDE